MVSFYTENSEKLFQTGVYEIFFFQKPPIVSSTDTQAEPEITFFWKLKLNLTTTFALVYASGKGA